MICGDDTLAIEKNLVAAYFLRRWLREGAFHEHGYVN
jgi:hypothetical protein